MYTVYALKSISKNYIYVGQTIKLKNRLDRHNKGWEKTTKPYRPFDLIYYEEVENRIIARQREKFLKSSSGKRFLRKIISSRMAELVDLSASM